MLYGFEDCTKWHRLQPMGFSPCKDRNSQAEEHVPLNGMHQMLFNEFINFPQKTRTIDDLAILITPPGTSRYTFAVNYPEDCPCSRDAKLSWEQLQQAQPQWRGGPTWF